MAAGITTLLVMVGGVTYAAWYHSNHQLDTTASAGMLDLSITHPVIVTTSNPYVDTETDVDVAGQLAHFHAHNLGPGDYSIMRATVTNTGTLPLLLGIDVALPTLNVVSGFYFFNTIANPSAVNLGPAMDGNTYVFPVVPNYSITLNSGENVVVFFALGLYANADQSMMGTELSVSYTITGMTVGGNGP